MLYDDHVHLAIQVADVALPKIVQNLSFRYTRHVNKRKKRHDHLFQGRYKAILVDGDSSLFELVRDIHLNPCRAGWVADPADYPWSGHRAYPGQEDLPWLTSDWVLSQFSPQKAAARRRYATFVTQGLRDPKALHLRSKGARLNHFIRCRMPRRTRFHLDKVTPHIVQRGHNREPCFFTDEDYHAYLYRLGEALQKQRCQLHAYVLMTKHVHVLLTPRKAESVARLMISLGRRYVQYINKTCRRTGTLWDSRYKSSLIQAATYLPACQRYIELNPVRAGMVKDPAHYDWSSYRHNALGEPDPILAPHPIYFAIAQTDRKRQAAYRALFGAAPDRQAVDDLRVALHQNQPLGNSRFHAKIESLTGERREARPRGRTTTRTRY